MNKIFILEDCPQRIEWFKKTFAGCELFITADVNKAFTKLDNEQFDIIFLDRDLSNPSFTGEDLAWNMKDHKIAASTPIVIHSENKRAHRVMPRYLKMYHNDVTVIPFPRLSSYSMDTIFKMNKLSVSEEPIKKADSTLDTFLRMQSPESQQKTQAAEALFRLWSSKGNKISKTRYRKPTNISSNDVDYMCKEGLVQTVGNNLEITVMGSEIIKIMILGDNRCALEKDYDVPIDIRVAQANIDKKKKTKDSKNEQDWWSRFMT